MINADDIFLQNLNCIYEEIKVTPAAISRKKSLEHILLNIKNVSK